MAKKTKTVLVCPGCGGALTVIMPALEEQNRGMFDRTFRCYECKKHWHEDSLVDAFPKAKEWSNGYDWSAWSDAENLEYK